MDSEPQKSTAVKGDGGIDGDSDGKLDGDFVILNVGDIVNIVGLLVTFKNGDMDGDLVGENVGLKVTLVGLVEGSTVA